MIKFIGVTFDNREQFGVQENAIIAGIKQQINQHWPDKKNLMINLTWFGPQFSDNNSCWNRVQDLILRNQKFDQIFWVCAVDPVCITQSVIEEIEVALHSKENYYIGVGFDGKHSFNTHAYVLANDFPEYTVDQLMLTHPTYSFLNYNRKPKPHRISLAQRLINYNGIVTLGKNDSGYDVSEGVTTDLYLAIDDKPEEYTHNGKFNIHTNFGGIPYDVCSLGRLDLWQQHFLNIVSETVFFPWDTTFISEKTWKPIFGLRPFIINGQPQIYQWLRDRGFRTFNQYWDQIPIESDSDIHDLIVGVVDFINTLTPEQLHSMYQQMLPDLMHNRQRFFEFAKEQQYKIENLFDE